jgi:hypothetical protein
LSSGEAEPELEAAPLEAEASLTGLRRASDLEAGERHAVASGFAGLSSLRGLYGTLGRAGERSVGAVEGMHEDEETAFGCTMELLTVDKHEAVVAEAREP